MALEAWKQHEAMQKDCRCCQQVLLGRLGFQFRCQFYVGLMVEASHSIVAAISHVAKGLPKKMRRWYVSPRFPTSRFFVSVYSCNATCCEIWGRARLCPPCLAIAIWCTLCTSRKQKDGKVFDMVNGHKMGGFLVQHAKSVRHKRPELQKHYYVYQEVQDTYIIRHGDCKKTWLHCRNLSKSQEITATALKSL